MVVLVAALLTVLLLLVLDVYLYQPVRVVTSHQQTAVKLALRGAYWMVSFILLAVVVVFYAAGPNYWGITARNWMMTAW